MSKNTRKILGAVLSAAVMFSAAPAAFAAEPQTMHDQILSTGVADRSPEYYALTKMWSNYFLDLLPDDTQPESLKKLTYLPAYDDVAAWKKFFHDGDPILMRDEAYRVAQQLGVTDPKMSLQEKIKRVSDWTSSGFFYQSVFARLGEIDGYVYDCTTDSEGAMTLYRLAGIPAVSVRMVKGALHEEAFFYDGNAWRFAHGGETFTDFFKSIDVVFVNEIVAYEDEVSYGLGADLILDINESWIGQDAEKFMLNLLCQPYANPRQKLTRGEVAKLLCNYLGAVPMRCEQVFSDVPATHKFSPYIWAMNKLGIMNGVGNSQFNPDAELTMQEFAVIAMRVVEYGGEQKVAYLKAELASIKNNPADWPPDLAYTKNVIADLEQRIKTGWKPSQNPNPIVFSDNDKIAGWAKPAVDEFSRFGILQGDSADSPKLNPAEPLSKTRFLIFLHKFEEKFKFTGNVGTAVF
jgi:hypothetical protein